MTPPNRTEELFQAALAREPDQQIPFLQGACAGDEELFLKVKDLLDAYADVRTTDSISPRPGASQPLLDSSTLIALGERYEHIKLIGHGGMGVVLRARDRELDKVVALKILHPSLADDERAVERFRNEIRLALDITHKNVCRTYGLERFDGKILISMEYVEGETLRGLLDRVKGVSVPQGLGWTLEICDALAAAHEKKVVHRDLKPENIMIDREGHVKVMDFGIARSIESAERTAGTVIGTPQYMSPEQALGRTVGPASDIYSVGLVLYELFTGIRREPEHPLPPRKVNPGLLAHIDRTICKCLQDAPRERFQSAGELAAALAGKGPEHKPRRSYLPLAVSVLGFLAIVVLSVNYWKPPKSPPAVPPQPKLEQSPKQIMGLEEIAPTKPPPPNKSGQQALGNGADGAWSATFSDAKVSGVLQMNLVQNSGGDVVGTYSSSLGGGGGTPGRS